MFVHKPKDSGPRTAKRAAEGGPSTRAAGCRREGLAPKESQGGSPQAAYQRDAGPRARGLREPLGYWASFCYGLDGQILRFPLLGLSSGKCKAFGTSRIRDPKSRQETQLSFSLLGWLGVQ